MLKFIDDLAGAISDFIKMIFSSIGYFLAGMIVVGALMYLITFIFKGFN